MTSAISARGLVKRFGAITAVDGIDLEIPEGGCYGMLGPNGAGKTSTIRMITCVSPPTEGSLEVFGLDVRASRPQIKRRIGVVPQGMTLDNELTVKENLVTHARYHGVARKIAEKRADELLEFTQLAERRESKVLHLSGGMQRRLLIARALVNDPELIVLDEPTTGLDPQARHLVWERLRTLKREGKTLLVTTHYMEEAAQLGDRIVVMDRGKIVAEGTPGELIHDHVPPRVVELYGMEDKAETVRGLLDGLVADLEAVGDRILAYTGDGEAVVRRIRESGFEHQSMLLRDATLEDVFLRLTGHVLVD
jgi:lipooligosaccharide transport system ATP-binding protein